MVSFRKKSIRIFGMLLVCMIYMYCGCIQIQATEAGQSSSDAQLQTFTATPGTMTPEFSPEVTGYMISVADDVEQVNVSCSLVNSSATVTEAKGFKNLKKGNNSAHITVKAPDGTICTYNFNIIRGGASNGAGMPAASSSGGGTFGFSVGSTPGTPITLKQNTEPVPPVTAEPQPTVTEPTATEPTMPEPTVNEPETAEPTGEDGQEAEPQAPENTDEGGEPFEDVPERGTDTEPIVETMAPISGAGERYPIGGDSIYANYYVRASFDESAVPAGFVLEPYNFDGATVLSAYFAAGNIRLVYAEAEDGNNGRLRLYYEDDKTVLDFVPFYQANGYVFPVRYQAQIPVPQNYTGSYMPFEQEVVSCYIYTELTDNKLSVPEGMENKNTLQPGESAADAEPVEVSSLDEMPEFYLFYGMNGNGEESFYLYDWIEGSCQRYVERDTSYDLDQSYFKYKDMAHRRFAIMCTELILLLVAGFFIVNLYMKNRELKQDMEDGNYDGDSDDEDDGDGSDDDLETEDLSEEYEADEAGEDEEYEEYEGEEAYEEAGEDEAYEDEEYESEDYEDREYEEADEEYADEYSEEYTEEYAEEAKKPSIGMTLSDFENSLQLESEEEDDVESKIISQLEKASDNTEPDSPSDGASADLRPPEFKMINLSRDPEPNGLDDDFEFEFIKFDDN